MWGYWSLFAVTGYDLIPLGVCVTVGIMRLFYVWLKCFKEFVFTSHFYRIVVEMDSMRQPYVL